LDAGAVLRYKNGSKTSEEPLWAAAFVTLAASNVSITGRGTLDANGFAGHGLYVLEAQDVAVHDIHIMGSQSWSVPIRLSRRVLFSHVKVFSGADGFDPDGSQDVTLDHVFVNSWDDAVAVKNTIGGGIFTERVTVQQSIVSTRKSGLKIGTESLDAFHDISFHDIDVFDTDRGVVLYAEDGGAIVNATWRNLRISFYDYLGESKSGRAFDFMLRARNGLSHLENVKVENIVSDVVCSSYFVGTEELPLGNVTFRNISLHVAHKNHVVRSNVPFLFDCRDANENKESSSLIMQGLQIDWGQQSQAWKGISQAHPGHDIPTGPFSVCSP